MDRRMSGDHEPKAGDPLGHYILVEELGRGGMGVVFKAHEESLDRHTAIKILSPRLARDPDLVTRFLSEARAVARLNHPNIIQVHYVGQQEDIYFFAMEFVEGRDFLSIIRERKQLTEREAAEFVRQAAQGLLHAQRKGVIHRDIKPANLMLSRDDVVKIADFGLARKVDVATGESLHLTMSGAVVGTPHYMSPEQVNGEKADHRSDIYALGATLYHMLAGRPPYVGESSALIMVHHLQSPLPPIREFNPSVSPATQAILAKALAKEPSDRYQGYEELIRDLDAIRAAPSTSTPGTWDQGGHRRAAIVALLILLAAGLAWYFFRTPSQSRPVTVTEAPSEPARAPTAVPVPAAEPATSAPYVAFDLSAACNADIIATESHRPGDFFETRWEHNLATTGALRTQGSEGEGVPDDGRLAARGSDPTRYFQIRMPPEKGAILLTDADGRQPKPVTLELTPEQTGKYSELYVLHVGTWGDGVVYMRMHYGEGWDSTYSLRILDWNERVRGHAPSGHASAALRATSTPGTSGAHPIDLFAETVATDPKRVLKSLTFTYESSTDPRQLGSNRGMFSAAILAVSGRRAP